VVANKDTNYLRTRIASELNRSLADAFGNSGETFAQVVNRAINQAIDHYASQPFRWNQVRRSQWASTVAYTGEYTLPPDFLMMTRLEITHSGRYIPIERTTLAEVDEINDMPSASLTGVASTIPSYYALDGNVVILAPPPNAAKTLAASYIKRYLPTSVTDSTTTKLVFAGSLTITPTTTTSHKNRLNGWTTDGDDLICARAKAIIRIDYLKDGDAVQEMAVIAGKGADFLSAAEKQAYSALADEVFDMQATGKVRKYGL
jgi:hypothetical protein